MKIFRQIDMLQWYREAEGVPRPISDLGLGLVSITRIGEIQR
jgi:hypothetical protein